MIIGLLLQLAPAPVQDLVPVTRGEVAPSSSHVAERLSPESFGPARVESMEEVLSRAGDAEVLPDPRTRQGAAGEWIVPPLEDAGTAHSGERYVFNSWGDTRLGIGFRRPVNLQGLWVMQHGSEGTTTSGVQVVGYLDGAEVGRSSPFRALSEKPTWWSVELPEVDRVVFLADSVTQGAGWFAIDDLTFDVQENERRRTLVVDFEELDYGKSLTGSGYFGLDWEVGSGDFNAKVHATAPIPGGLRPTPAGTTGTSSSQGLTSTPTRVPSATNVSPTISLPAPQLGTGILGPKSGDTGTLSVPDTNGAAGPDHYVAAPNGHLAIYERATGQKLIDVAQTTFFAAGGILGDPRIAYDAEEDRFVLIASDWDSRVYLAYSMTSDPTGSWFKTSFVVAQGSDAGKFPDYPTLGVDDRGIYTALFMAPGGMSLFAIDKQPLLATTPSLGTVTAWRSLPLESATPLESAIQPCVTAGSSGGVFLVSGSGNQSLRIRQVTGALTAPVLEEKGLVSVPAFSTAGAAPQRGTAIRLSARSTAAMNAVYRAGSLYTAHCIDVGGRAALRWYQINPDAPSLVQFGTVADPVRSFFMPSIAVNSSGDMALGFTGSSASEFASVYATGRKSSFPAGVTGAPVLVHPGQGPYTFLDFQGVSRWGDYSVTGVDPVDDQTFWTVQQFALSPNEWGLWIQALSY